MQPAPNHRHSVMLKARPGAIEIIGTADHEIKVVQAIALGVSDAKGMVVGIGETAHQVDAAVDLIGCAKVEDHFVKFYGLAVARRSEHDMTQMLDLRHRG